MYNTLLRMYSPRLIDGGNEMTLLNPPKHSTINPRNIAVLTSKPYSYITSHKTFTTDVALDTSSPSVAQGIIITTFFFIITLIFAF